MTCFYPLAAWRLDNGDISFNLKHRGFGRSLNLPCGQCIGCRLERSRQWAIRCMHEASLYEKNCFITLTYRDADLPQDMSVNVRHFQLFMKKLRKRYGPNIRFYHCGEYGSKFGRPHYHACLFNFDFADKVLFTVNNGQPLYTSKSLDELWGKGFASIGTVTFESAAYVARYIMKKVNGKLADDHYDWCHPVTGQIYARSPEYTTMSRRPGIGSGWYDKYSSDVYPHDRVIINGRPMRPPKFYDGLYEIDDPEGFEQLKFERENKAKKYLDDQTPDRLKVREAVQLAALKKLPRNLD